ncbi:hypothetical protein QUV83_14065 [Cellulomonas cellasea]|uniref:hypothetical protein n=1 Tax=Cellulomonas cellasea TaxID=43670 RepID=UPI0025A3FEFE|nr:hypothetical protein [Cellulomonas cellasea]MDM8085898.1 hypothetical protein [Cellulomonas cellasea]
MESRPGRSPAPTVERRSRTLADATAPELLEALVAHATAAIDPMERLRELTEIDRLLAAEGGVTQQLREARTTAITELRGQGMPIAAIAAAMGVTRGRVHALLAGNPVYGRRQTPRAERGTRFADDIDDAGIDGAVIVRPEDQVPADH